MWIVKRTDKAGEMQMVEFEVYDYAVQVYDSEVLKDEASIELIECSVLAKHVPLSIMGHKVAYRDSNKLDGPDLIIEQEGDDDIT